MTVADTFCPATVGGPLPETEGEWASLLRLLPGYDPFSDTGGAEFVPERAVRVIRFFERQLTHGKGGAAGKPLNLAAWQRAFVANLFGWIGRDGFRRYRRGLIMVPRKNGKSVLAAGIGLYSLVADNEHGAEVYGAAGDRDQAAVVFDHALSMVRQNPILSRELVAYTNINYRQIKYPKLGGVYRVLASDAKSAHGLNVSCAIIDELHAHKDAEFYEALSTGVAARDQPIVLGISTMDYDRESLCNDQYTYANGVRSGTISDPGFLPCVYDTGPDADWHDPAVWAAANPNLGVSVRTEYIEAAHKRACNEAGFENEFKRLHLNMRTGQESRWIRMDEWDACSASVEDEDLDGAPCWFGMDLSATRDITALCAVWDLGGTYAARWWFWLPGRSAQERARAERVPFDVWQRQGHVEVQGGHCVDLEAVEAKIIALAERYRPCEIAYDPYAADRIRKNLEDNHGLNMVEFRQGFLSMTPACRTLDRVLGSGLLRHGGNPVARWMASNVSVDRDPAGNMKPNKVKSGEKIDGIVALLMALHRAVGEGGEIDCGDGNLMVVDLS